MRLINSILILLLVFNCTAQDSIVMKVPVGQASGMASGTLDTNSISGFTAKTKALITWGNVTSKPSTYTPATHNHVKADITDFGNYTNISDTAAMLLNYKNAMIAAAANILLKVNISDTATMLANYRSAMIANTAGLLLKVNTADTSGKWAAGVHTHTNIGYTLSVQALTSSPTDGQTIYFGNLPKAPVTTQGTSKIYIRQAGTIKRAEIYCFSGTAGTNEAWPISIRLNNSGDTQIASLSVNTSERVWSNTGLSIAVAAGDYIEIKSVNPTWATNPLTTIFGGYIYIE